MTSRLILIVAGLIMLGCTPEHSPSAHCPNAFAIDFQAEAVEQLNAYGHEVYYEDGAGLSLGNGHVALLHGWRTQGQKIRAEDAKLLSQLGDLVELRVLPVGGPPDEFWDKLGEIDTVLDFTAHYGLSNSGVLGLRMFPNLRTLTIWGRSTQLNELPNLPQLRVIHVEEKVVNAEDVMRIRKSCPRLEVFECDAIEPAALTILKSIETLTVVRAGDYEKSEVNTS